MHHFTILDWESSIPKQLVSVFEKKFIVLK
jgi:hypothetical protein